MTWPKSTWTAWKSDSTNPSLLVLLRGEGLDPWSCILDLCSCLLSPCIQLWLSPSPCLDEMSSAIKDWLRKLTGQLVTYYWHPLFAFSRGALIQPVLFCATLHLPNQRTLNRSSFYIRPLSRQPDYLLYTMMTGFKELSCVLPYYEQTLKGNYSWWNHWVIILCLFVTL